MAEGQLFGRSRTRTSWFEVVAADVQVPLVARHRCPAYETSLIW